MWLGVVVSTRLARYDLPIRDQHREFRLPAHPARRVPCLEREHSCGVLRYFKAWRAALCGTVLTFRCS
jgi:hypothetical protein